jgi:hypothetical protein
MFFLQSIILPVVLYGCETWCLTLREEHKLRVFDYKVLRRTFEPKRDGVKEVGGNCVAKSCMICTLGQVE